MLQVCDNLLQYLFYIYLFYNWFYTFYIANITIIDIMIDNFSRNILFCFYSFI